jgi:DNA-binding LytR/AlgR family response regulator
MKVLIIEDEPLAVERLQYLLKEVRPDATVCGIAHSVEDAVLQLKKESSPDLILMDIELRDGLCFEIWKQVPVKSPVIFITSYDEYTLKAFEVSGMDYLLKPIKKSDLSKSLEKLDVIKNYFIDKYEHQKLKQLLEEFKTPQQKKFRDRFMVKTGNRYYSIELEQIAYFFTEGRYTYCFTKNEQKYIIDYTLDDLTSMLDNHYFFRANRAMIVQINSIELVHDSMNGKLELKLFPQYDKEVLVSKEKAMEFKLWLGK